RHLPDFRAQWRTPGWHLQAVRTDAGPLLALLYKCARRGCGGRQGARARRPGHQWTDGRTRRRAHCPTAGSQWGAVCHPLADRRDAGSRGGGTQAQRRQAAPRPAGKVAKRAAKKAAKKAPKKAPRKAPAKKQAKRAAKKAAKKVAKKVARKAATRRGARGAGKTVRRAAKRVAKRAGKKAAKKTAKKAGRKAAGKRGG